jgi:hypothetical protein
MHVQPTDGMRAKSPRLRRYVADPAAVPLEVCNARIAEAAPTATATAVLKSCLVTG